jgi:hypothetical protein
VRAWQREYQRTHREKFKFFALKRNAAVRSIPFLLSKEELVALLKAEKCPICRTPMHTRGAKNAPDNRSIDRIDSSGPYSMKNCACICYRCNNIKSYGTRDDHRRIAAWMGKIGAK